MSDAASAAPSASVSSATVLLSMLQTSDVSVTSVIIFVLVSALIFPDTDPVVTETEEGSTRKEASETVILQDAV